MTGKEFVSSLIDSNVEFQLEFSEDILKFDFGRENYCNVYVEPEKSVCTLYLGNDAYPRDTQKVLEAVKKAEETGWMFNVDFYMSDNKELRLSDIFNLVKKGCDIYEIHIDVRNKEVRLEMEKRPILATLVD